MIIEAMRKQCHVCGFPWVTSFVLRWRDNGAITMFMRNDYRAVVMRQGQVQPSCNISKTSSGCP